MAIGIPLRRPRQKTAVSSRLVCLHSEFQTSVSYEVRLSQKTYRKVCWRQGVARSRPWGRGARHILDEETGKTTRQSKAGTRGSTDAKAGRQSADFPTAPQDSDLLSAQPLHFWSFPQLHSSPMRCHAPRSG